LKPFVSKPKKRKKNRELRRSSRELRLPRGGRCGSSAREAHRRRRGRARCRCRGARPGQVAAAAPPRELIGAAAGERATAAFELSPGWTLAVAGAPGRSSLARLMLVRDALPPRGEQPCLKENGEGEEEWRK
jgi:hypothetical protein